MIQNILHKEYGLIQYTETVSLLLWLCHIKIDFGTGSFK